jgi:hypothetical protein
MIGDAKPAQATILYAAAAGAARHAVDLIALYEQKLRKIDTVLPSDACDKSFGHFCSVSCW